MRPKPLVSASLYALGCAVLFAFAGPSIGSAGSQKVKVTKPGKAVGVFPGPKPWDGFSPYRSGGGQAWGVRAGGGAMPHVFGLAGSLPMSLGSVPGLSPFGGMGAPTLGGTAVEWSPYFEQEWLPFGSGIPDAGGWRAEMLRQLNPDYEVVELLRLARNPAATLRPTRGPSSHLFQLDDDLSPFRLRGSTHGLGGVFGGVDPLAGLGGWQGLSRSVAASPSMRHAADVMRLIEMVESPEFGLSLPHARMGGIGRLNMGVGGGLVFPHSRLMFPELNSYGLPGLSPYRAVPGWPGMNRSPFGFDPLRGGMYGVPRFGPPVVRARARRAGPTVEEQKAAMQQFHQSLVVVEAMARAGAWTEVGEGLRKSLSGSSLPQSAVAPLKGLQAEATQLAELFRLRGAIAAGWDTSPDAAALATALDAVRTATGDRDFADRVKRVLAVKAVWEGFDAAAVALSPTGNQPDLDAELDDLRRPRATGPVFVPIATADDRELARRRVVRAVLEEIDQHIDAGRYTAAAHLKDVREMRLKAKSFAASGGAKAPPVTDPAAVAEMLKRPLTDADLAVLRKMTADGKSIDEIVEVLR